MTKTVGGNLGLRCFWEPVAKRVRFSASVAARENRNIKSTGNRVESMRAGCCDFAMAFGGSVRTQVIVDSSTRTS